MTEEIRLLVALQDLDMMIKESKQEEEHLGFKIQNVAKLMEAREELAARIDVKWLRVYERVATKHGRGIVPVKRGVCLGCFMSLPTSHQVSQQADVEVSLCENCGRILYWL